MKIISLVLLTITLLFSCKNSSSSNTSINKAELQSLEEWTQSIIENKSEYSGKNEFETSFLTSQGSYSISTMELKIRDNGENYFTPSPDSVGYFVVPRMCRVATLEEAQEMILEDYKAGKGRPEPLLQLSKSELIKMSNKAQ